MKDCGQDFAKVSTTLQPNFAEIENNTGLTAEDLSDEIKREVLPVTIMIGVEAVLGVIGNMLIIIVYIARYRQCNFKYFVLYMALIDLTSCLTTLPGEIFSQLHWYSYKQDWICKIKSYFNVFTVWSSALALLLLAYDRYRKICQPLDWQIQPSWAMRFCVISISISAIISAPIAILWGTQSYVDHHNNQNITVTICEKSSFYADGIYPFLFIVTAYMIPIIIMICITYFLNFKIARAIFFNIPAIEKPCSMTIHEYDADVIATKDGSAVEHDQRYHDNGPEIGCSCEFIDRRTSPNMKLCHPDEQSESIQDREDTEDVDTIAELNHNHTVQNCSSVTDHMCTTPDINGYLQDSCCRRKGQCKSSRHSSTCSSDSSVSIILKYSQRSVVSAKCIPQDRIRRTRTSESKRCSLDEMVENGHTCIRQEIRALRLKRKTEIMLILTTVFTVTIIIYLILVTLVASQQSILRHLTKSEKVIFFFFWRLYFINCVINPVLYGLLDPRFTKGLKEIFCRDRKQSPKSTRSQATLV